MFRFVSNRSSASDFFNGNVAEAVEQVSRNGGLVAAPAAPSLVNLRYDADYRSAVLATDLVIQLYSARGLRPSAHFPKGVNGRTAMGDGCGRCFTDC